MSHSTYTVHPSIPHTHTVIFLHGRDSTAEEFATEIFESQGSDEKTLPEALPSYKWVFPTSRIRQSSRFQTEMSQWFDIWTVENPQEKLNIQQTGLQESIMEVLDLISEEGKLVRSDHIILAGISQGCATAIHALFNLDYKLGAFVGLSSWLPYSKQIQTIIQSGNESSQHMRHIRSLITSEGINLIQAPNYSSLETPVFLRHCKDDDVVPSENGENLFDTLKLMGMSVDSHVYEEGGHWLNEPKGVDDLVRFLKQNQE
ncbi:alpha/beta-hydrolase [Microthyrium microscopicum]|uniref:Alpha/beta-hydrolase n=1 Tax=Microthyrium microscopicum TaxID=703497 RepID=A0A6A6TXP8_9PEZI|nr:alpha/beta-hydrolase [Microthyrium microscopicum]